MTPPPTLSSLLVLSSILHKAVYWLVVVVPVLLLRLGYVRQQAWEHITTQMHHDILTLEPPVKREDSRTPQQSQQTQQSWGDLPPVVQRYLHQTFQQSLHPRTNNNHNNNNSNKNHKNDLSTKRRWEEPEIVRRPTHVTFGQHGEFRLDDNPKKTVWIPYQANQITSSRGFLWKCHWSILSVLGACVAVPEDDDISQTHYHRQSSSTSRLSSFLKRVVVHPLLQIQWIQDIFKACVTVWIVDAYVIDQPSWAQVSYGKGVVTFIDSTPPTTTKSSTQAEAAASDNDTTRSKSFERTLWISESMRYLAELVLLPTLVLPESNLVRWHSIDPNDGTDSQQAILQLPLSPPASLSSSSVDPSKQPKSPKSSSIQLVATFDSNTGWLTQLAGNRPNLQANNITFVTQSWFATLNEYQWSDQAQLWYPSHVQAGWRKIPSPEQHGDKDSTPTQGSVSSSMDDDDVAIRANQTNVTYYFG